MPAAITCPRCRHHFLLEDTSATEAQCPECQTRLKVRVPAPGADAPKPSPDDPVACLQKHYPDLSDEDARLAADLLGPERCRIDRAGLAPLKQVPRPSRVPDLPTLRKERERALAEAPPATSRFTITSDRQFYAVWGAMALLGVSILVAGAVFIHQEHLQWAKIACIALGLAAGLTGASTLYRRLRGQQDVSEVPVQRGSPQGAIRMFYERGVLANRFDQAHELLSPTLRERLTPAQLKAAWSHWFGLVHKLLSLQPFQAHIYEQLGPGFDVEGPKFETTMEADVQPAEEAIGQGTIRITFRGLYTIHEQEAYKDWNREHPDSGEVTCVYQGTIGLVQANDRWLIADVGPANFRMTEFHGTGALEVVKFDPGGVAKGQLDLDVIEHLILSATHDLKKRGWF